METKQNTLFKNKKGLSGLENIMSGFVVVGAVMFLIVLLIFTFSIVTTGLEETKDVQSTVNQTGYVNITAFQLASGIGGNPRDYNVVVAINYSGAVIPTTNYTFNTTNGQLVGKPGANYANANITYTYNNNSAEIIASQNAQTNTSRVIPLVGILFIILAIGAVIAILMSSMLGKRSS